MFEEFEELKNELLDEGISLRTINAAFKKVNEEMPDYPQVTLEEWLRIAEFVAQASGNVTKGIDYDQKERHIHISVDDAFITAMDKELDIVFIFSLALIFL